jgi:RNA polymerase sigma-70 factor (ECF subfamily)
LSSQVFTRALGGLKGYRGGSVAAWLFQIAHNVVVNHLQARQRRPQVSLENDENLFREEELGGVEDGTLEQLIQVEERQQIARLIAALPAEQRELLLLKLVDRLSAKEIGAMLGKSEGAVRIAIYRIMQQLRASYEQLDKEQAG